MASPAPVRRSPGVRSRGFMQGLALLALASCTLGLDPRRDLPVPVRVSGGATETPTATAASGPPGPAALAARAALPANVRVVLRDTGIDPREAEQAVREALAFLAAELPAELYQDDEQVTVRVGRGGASQAVTTIHPSLRRSVDLDAINIYPGQRHYVVHELFHALYQKRRMFSGPVRELEGWATYFQYRFRYRGVGNRAIARKLVADYRITPDVVAIHGDETLPNTAMTAFEAERKYAVFALPLFERTPLDNIAAYTELMTNRAIARPPPRKRD